MPRRKLSEYKSKQIVSQALGLDYVGWTLAASSITDDLKHLGKVPKYVVKVDQAVKGRFKKGLVTLDVPREKIESILKKYIDESYAYFIVEPYVMHEKPVERYLTLGQDRNGLKLSYSSEGGVDIESHAQTIKLEYVSDDTDWKRLSKQTLLSSIQLQALLRVFKDNYFTFLEINPYIEIDQGVKLLDIAVEVDDAGQGLVSSWEATDIREPKRTTWTEEEVVRQLDKGSVASFNLSVINPNGSVFLLLSGGGASVVIADEVYNRGLGEQLANYGEYSGNPEAHETQKYTSQVLSLLVASNAPRKVLFIGGAVANFTDVATTFGGVIAAIDQYSAELSKQHVKVYVRRGGPSQELGLKNIRLALERHNILGGVYDPSTTIVDALGAALKGLEK
jgi:ATP-citrate lyase beta-subunit